jgi:hypothetical protein
MPETKIMKNFKSFAVTLGLLLAASFACGQTVLVNTTLSAAVPASVSSALTSGNQAIVSVASASGISAPSPNTSNTYGAATSEAQTYLYVDRELMQVKGVSGTQITVIRGVGSTAAASHASAAAVFVVPSAAAAYWAGGAYGTPPAVPQGSCTRTSELFLPRIQFISGLISDCIGGQWVNGDILQTTRLTYNGLRYPDPGATALTALETAGTAAAASTEIYCTEIDLPFSMLMTGLGVLNGTTVGTNKHFAILYDSSGNVLANSATGGTTTAGASTYQKLNFVNKYFAVGPGRYFACDGLNGTTDTIRHAITAVNDNVLGGTITGQTFGTAAAITVPSSFTTAKVPYFLVF